MRPGAGHRGGRFPPPDQQQPPSSRQPDEPRNTDQNPPAANDPRPYKKRGKQSPWHLAGVGEQNLAPPVTRTPPAEDSQRLNGKRKRKPTKELAGQGLQEQHPSVQTPQPHQQQQFSPFPSFFQHPLIFQTLHPKQQFSSFPSFVPQLMLFTVDGSPTSYDTVFEDLHPDSQKLLLKIEKRILEYRAESERMDQCIRLYDLSVSSDSFGLDASRILQELGGITIAIEREVSVQDLMKKVNDIMRHAEFAIHSYMMLRPRFLHQNVLASSGIGSASHTVGAAGTSGQTNQLMTKSISPVFEFYSGIPIRPSQFMHHIAARFEKYITQCCQWIEKLEQLVLMDTDKTSSNSLEALSRVMSNICDYFIHVAAQVENLHQYVESKKMAFLGDWQRLGGGNDPFLEASRREAAKRRSCR